MRFGNLFIHQHKGIAMGMAPAPSIANLFVAIYEQTHISSFPPSMLHFLRRFINDGFGIWIRDENTERDTENWERFQQLVNNMGLQWEFSNRSQNVTFMDLNITLTNGKLYTSLYAKPLALHLYIPPTSCHAPGIASGLIHGHLHRVFLLCSHEKDIENEIYLFFNRLLDRGYSLPHLLPIFLNAEKKARQLRDLNKRAVLQNIPRTCPRDTNTLATTPEIPALRQQQEDDNGVFFHLKYHPSNPPAGEIQKIWRNLVLTPPNATPLYNIRNRDGYPVNIKKLTIAYSRAPNLGNLLSCRKLHVNVEDYTDSHTSSLLTTEELRHSGLPDNEEPDSHTGQTE